MKEYPTKGKKNTFFIHLTKVLTLYKVLAGVGLFEVVADQGSVLVIVV